MIEEIEKMAEERAARFKLLGWNPVETLPEGEGVVILVPGELYFQVMMVIKLPEGWRVLQGVNGANGMCREINGIKGWMPVM